MFEICSCDCSRIRWLLLSRHLNSTKIMDGPEI
jgi:hypothetical protein